MGEAVHNNTAWLLIGGNLDNREQTLAQATGLIRSGCGGITRVSSIYETEAWGKRDQPAFLNQVMELQTHLDAFQLLNNLLSIEKKLGRSRDEKYGPRLIDIDILLFNDDIINGPSLEIPHPRLHERRFVLIPLAEIAADKIHPVFHKTIAQLLEACPDRLKVSLYLK